MTRAHRLLGQLGRSSDTRAAARSPGISNATSRHATHRGDTRRLISISTRHEVSPPGVGYQNIERSSSIGEGNGAFLLLLLLRSIGVERIIRVHVSRSITSAAIRGDKWIRLCVRKMARAEGAVVIKRTSTSDCIREPRVNLLIATRL